MAENDRKEYDRLYKREWNRKNPDRKRAAVLKAQQTRRALISTIKDVPCMDCGNRYPSWVMQFDHRPEHDKSFNIGANVYKKLDEVLAEIAKCDIVCANCHAQRTYERMQSRN